MEATLYIVLVVMFGFWGLVLGSFVNAWVWRTSQDISVADGRSKCPHCKHQLAWYDLLPVVSYLTLAGKCRYCAKPISAQYPTVELATSALFVLLLVSSGLTMNTAYAWVQFGLLLGISVLLVASFVYDALYMQLPDKFTLPAICLAIVSLGLKGLTVGWSSLTPQLVGLGLAVMAFTALWYFSRGKWLGSGDIRLIIVMGLLLEPKALVVGIFMAYLLGAVYGIFVLQRLKPQKRRRVMVPFGPFLILGLYFGLLLGTKVADWYLSLL